MIKNSQSRIIYRGRGGFLPSNCFSPLRRALAFSISCRVSPLKSFYDQLFHTKWTNKKYIDCLIANIILSSRTIWFLFQALAAVTQYIKKNDLNELTGLLTREALIKFKEEVSKWDSRAIEGLPMQTEDIQGIRIRKIDLQTIVGKIIFSSVLLTDTWTCHF